MSDGYGCAKVVEPDPAAMILCALLPCHIRELLELEAGVVVFVEFDDAFHLADVRVDGATISPEQWLRLERAGLPMHRWPVRDDGNAPTVREGSGR